MSHAEILEAITEVMTGGQDGEDGDVCNLGGCLPPPILTRLALSAPIVEIVMQGHVLDYHPMVV